MPSSKNRRRTPQQSRSRATVDAILDSVTRTLRKEGTEALTTNRLAQVAGVSIGTLYQYFGSKQDIFDALHDRHFERMAASVQDALTEDEPRTLHDLLAVLVDTVIAVRANDPELHRLLMTTVPRGRPNAAAEAQRLHGTFHRAVARHRHELRDDCDLDRFVFVLASMIQGLTSAAVLSRPPRVGLPEAQDEILIALDAYISLYRRGPAT